MPGASSELTQLYGEKCGLVKEFGKPINDRRGEKKRVDPVEHSAMAGDDIS